MWKVEKYFTSTENRVVSHRLEVKKGKFMQDMRKNLLKVRIVRHFRQNAE